MYITMHILVTDVKIPMRLIRYARDGGSVPCVELPVKFVDRGGHGKWVA